MKLKYIHENKKIWKSLFSGQISVYLLFVEIVACRASVCSLFSVHCWQLSHQEMTGMLKWITLCVLASTMPPRTTSSSPTHMLSSSLAFAWATTTRQATSVSCRSTTVVTLLARTHLAAHLVCASSEMNVRCCASDELVSDADTVHTSQVLSRAICPHLTCASDKLCLFTTDKLCIFIYNSRKDVFKHFLFNFNFTFVQATEFYQHQCLSLLFCCILHFSCYMSIMNVWVLSQ